MGNRDDASAFTVLRSVARTELGLTIKQAHNDTSAFFVLTILVNMCDADELGVV